MTTPPPSYPTPQRPGRAGGPNGPTGASGPTGPTGPAAQPGVGYPGQAPPSSAPPSTGTPYGAAPAYPPAHRPGFVPDEVGYVRPGTGPARLVATAATAPTAATAATAATDWRARPSGWTSRSGLTITLLVVGFAALWGLRLVLEQVGVNNLAIGFLAALLPLAGVLAAVLWLDRWEPEPRHMLMIALLWGAGVSVVVAYYGNTWVMLRVYELTGDPALAEALSSVVSAPVVEEGVKGLGVLLIFLLRRSHFDGVVDGIVYAAIVAAGFAFTENVLYFGRLTDSLGEVFVMRGVVSPFAHLLFTACIGIALGLAAGSRRRSAAWWMFPLGYLAAIGLHALWNGMATLSALHGDEGTFYALYLLIQVPLFASAVVLAVWLRRQESRTIAARLHEYAAAGWFAPHEVEMVASLRQRGQARAWAARLGPSAGAAMSSFVRDATALALLRQRAASGRVDLAAHTRRESELLTRVGADRRSFLSAAQAAGPVAPR